jgi:ubiquinone/menaquinone biosynthesis C-methylase UbiE
MAERSQHPIFARLYARLSERAESELAQHRDRLLAGLTGRVIDVGAGNGLNFDHYPPAVEQVLAVDPEPHLRGIAGRKAAQAPVVVQVVDGVAGDLPAADESFDAAVCSLVLCSVPDQHLALADIRRVLRPGGQLRFLEHVRADTAGLARIQQVLDATVWPRLAGGCHTGRDTAAAIERAGMVIDQIDVLRLPRSGPPVSPFILGTATRP